MMKGGQYKMFEEYSNNEKPLSRRKRSNGLFYLVAVILLLGVLLTGLNIYELHRMRADHELHQSELAKLPAMEAEASDQTYATSKSPIVWLQGSPKSKNNGPNGYLKHVYRVFEKMGFTLGENLSDWVVAWIHDYPFITYSQVMKNLKPHQKVNHFPGSGYITNKVSLAQTNMDFIPKAFAIPAKKKEFLAYAEKHKDTKWVQKSNQHRGIEVKTVDKVNLTKEGSFIQEFIANPLLIDGRKFDIGVYTIITSIDPVRVYFVDGDTLFRFCPQEYYPFDSAVLDKYVVGDDYMPLWKMQSLEHFYVDQGYSFKDSFKEYLRSIGKDPESVYEKMKSAIREVVLLKEPDLIKSVLKYPSKRNFFELIRFDFVLDENLNVFLMEGNMSPNLSSDHFPKNARLYEHVIFNFLGLVGVGHFTSTSDMKRLAHEDPMRVSSQDIQVFPDYCRAKLCMDNCQTLVCKLCKQCLSSDFSTELKIAYLEHARRGSTRRIFPPSMSQEEALAWAPETDLPLFTKLNLKNKLMYLWFIGKCRLDAGWCP